ncbi:hypothetical protein STENM36S_00197 [Streptomyces tendae]
MPVTGLGRDVYMRGQSAAGPPEGTIVRFADPWALPRGPDRMPVRGHGFAARAGHIQGT